MQLTTPQLQSLKAWVNANASGIYEQSTADTLNAVASPAYWVWRTQITRTDLYDNPSPAGTFWDWTTFKGQGVSEQGAWREMFMGDAGRISLANWREGVAKIFSGSGAPATQRSHVFAAGRRQATVGEKLLAVAVVNPPANTGNDGGTRGTTTNPDNFGDGAEGDVTLQNLIDAANS